MSNVEKIFVDPDEEIVFTVEKIRAAKSDRVVLVVPQNASLMSSIVSLKLLSRQMQKQLDKTVVIVTDNETGIKLGEKAKLIVKAKISGVDSAVWQEARELAESERDKKDQLKKELLSARKEGDADTKDTVVAEKKHEMVKGVVVDDEPETEPADDPGQVFAEKPRLESKVVEINGITVVAGGDISEDMELLMSEKRKHLPKQNPAVKQTLAKSGPLLGRDLTRAAGAGLEKLNTLKKNSTSIFKKIADTVGPTLKKLLGSNKSKVVELTLAAIVVFFLVSYFFFARVTVDLTFAQDSVTLNEAISGSTSIDEVDLEQLLVPVEQVSKVKSISLDGKATGKGFKGAQAQGIVDLRNKTSATISLKSGVKISNIATGLKYVVQQDIDIPANDSAEDIAIKAETFGDNYNVVDQDVTFKIDGYDSNDLIGFAFRDITGGTKVEATVVSQEDLDALKKKADDELRGQLQADVASLISADEILLTGSEKFTESSYTASAEVNKEVADFSVNLEVKVDAFKVTKADLEVVAREIIKKEEASTESAQVDVTDPEIKNIVIDGASVKFDLSSDASVQEDIDEQMIRDNIKGKKVEDAREYLSDLDGLESFRVRYRPSYIPYFMQRVPDDPAKLTIAKSA